MENSITSSSYRDLPLFLNSGFTQLAVAMRDLVPNVSTKNKNKVEKSIYSVGTPRLALVMCETPSFLPQVFVCVFNMKRDKITKKTRLWSSRVVIRIIWDFLQLFENVKNKLRESGDWKFQRMVARVCMFTYWIHWLFHLYRKLFLSSLWLHRTMTRGLVYVQHET